MAADIVRIEERRRVVQAARDALGPIDVLVNDSTVESQGPLPTCRWTKSRRPSS
jgi:short-subunit dehydrogenase